MGYGGSVAQGRLTVMVQAPRWPVNDSVVFVQRESWQDSVNRVAEQLTSSMEVACSIRRMGDLEYSPLGRMLMKLKSPDVEMRKAALSELAEAEDWDASAV